MNIDDKIKGVFFGAIVGDALGVPVEFKSRKYLKTNPVKDMLEFGVHEQPKGTWSDDSSLILATIAGLENGYDKFSIIDNFCNWYFNNEFTPHREVFDCGGQTSDALFYYKMNKKILNQYNDRLNGNGSLMRILPVSLIFRNEDIEKIKDVNFEISALTHGHIRSQLCCFYFSLIVKYLFSNTIDEAYNLANTTIKPHIPIDEKIHFKRILSGDIGELSENAMQSSGYVIHSLESSLWCIFNSSSYAEAVLKAVNLGDDTDTTACITGALAGIMYGYNTIPKTWINSLVKLQELNNYYEILSASCI